MRTYIHDRDRVPSMRQSEGKTTLGLELQTGGRESKCTKYTLTDAGCYTTGSISTTEQVGGHGILLLLLLPTAGRAGRAEDTARERAHTRAGARRDGAAENGGRAGPDGRGGRGAADGLDHRGPGKADWIEFWAVRSARRRWLVVVTV